MTKSATVGIERAAAHVPRYRLARADIAAAWGGRGRGGERAVANYDEDAVTMTVAAAERCLGDVDRSSVDLVVLASTTHTYAEKQGAAIVAEALDLRPDVDTIDIGSSLRAGTQALRVGLNAVAAGARRVLVAVADMRKTQAGSRGEAEMGDAAVALLLGRDPVVSIRTLRSEYSTAIDRWRLPGDDYVRQGDERFTSTQLFQDGIRNALRNALAGAGLASGDIRHVAIAGSDFRACAGAAKAAGFAADTVAGEVVYTKAGHCGTAAGLLNLLAALERARAGEPILLANYGDGTDVLLATPASPQPFGTQLAQALDDGMPLAYAQFLRFKGLVDTEAVEPYTSEISVWRDARYIARLRAPRCNRCGAIQYPPRRICFKCAAKDEFTEVGLAKEGKLYTFTVEHLYPIPDTHLVTGVVDLCDGARLFTQVTDCAPDAVQIGMDLRLTFRVLHRGGGFYQYAWKAAPPSARQREA